MGKMIELVNPEDIEALAHHYLHDFVRSMHTCNHKNPGIADLEYEVHYGRKYLMSYHVINITVLYFHNRSSAEQYMDSAIQGFVIAILCSA